jgi:hypothetical protein
MATGDIVIDIVAAIRAVSCCFSRWCRWPGGVILRACARAIAFARAVQDPSFRFRFFNPFHLCFSAK